MMELFHKKLKNKLIVIGILVAVGLVALHPQTVSGQVVDGYVKVNAFERKVTPSQVFKGEKFQGLIRGDATLVKDLPLNTNVEADYVVKAKLDGGKSEEVVGKGTIKVGPLPSVKAGANINLTENMELLFPESAIPGKYALVVEATSIRPFVIYMIIDLVFPGLQSTSLSLGTVQYMGERTSLSTTNVNSIQSGGGGNSDPAPNLILNAPGEALATTNIEIEIQVLNSEKAPVALYLQKGAGEKSRIKDVTVPGDKPVKESITTPDYNGNVKISAEIKDFYAGGKQTVLSTPLVKSIDISLKRRPLQAAGKIDEKGIVKDTLQVVSQDNKAEVRLQKGTLALTTDKQPVSELTVTVEPSPPEIKDGLIIGQAYNLQPRGASFEPPIQISIKYDKSQLPENVKEGGLAIAYFNPISGWERLPGNLDMDQQLVTAEVRHFSLFAVVGEVTEINYWLILFGGAALGTILMAGLFLGWRALARR